MNDEILSSRVKSKINTGMFTSNKDGYETPQDLFDTLNKEFHFELDAAASAENAKCPRYYTKEDDALKQSWGNRSWCNPPYGREIGKFVRKAFEESVHRYAVAVMLLPARTDTKWWHDYVMHAREIRFIRGRLKFGGETNSAPFPSCIVVFDGVINTLRISAINTDGTPFLNGTWSDKP